MQRHWHSCALLARCCFSPTLALSAGGNDVKTTRHETYSDGSFEHDQRKSVCTCSGDPLMYAYTCCSPASCIYAIQNPRIQLLPARTNYKCMCMCPAPPAAWITIPNHATQRVGTFLLDRSIISIRPHDRRQCMQTVGRSPKLVSFGVQRFCCSHVSFASSKCPSDMWLMLAMRHNQYNFV